MHLKFVFLAILVEILKVIVATNYCDKSLCRSGKHIACNNRGKFARTCKNPVMAKLTKENKNLIVDIHNTKRDLVAGGRTALRPACRMATMQWDEELASLAALNVKQCQMKHDDCHNTDAFKYSGQNLAWIGFVGSADIAALMQESIDTWYNEIEDTKMDYINKYPSGYSGPAIGHFTVMVADRNMRVGCAAITYTLPGQYYKEFLFACNYATTNMVDFPIYKDCPTAALDCRKGKNPDFKNLCSISENYDVNKWF